MTEETTKEAVDMVAAYEGVPVSSNETTKQREQEHSKKNDQYQRIAMFFSCFAALLWLLTSCALYSCLGGPCNLLSHQVQSSSRSVTTTNLPITTRSGAIDKKHRARESSKNDQNLRIFEERSLSHIRSSNPFVFVLFYASWSQYSQEILPAWNAFTTEGVDGAVILKMDCVNHHDFCHQETLLAYPALRLYVHGEAATQRFKGDRKVKDDLRSYVVTMMDRDAETIKDRDESNARLTQSIRRKSNNNIISNAVAAQENFLDDDDNYVVHFDGKPLSHKSNARLTQSIRRKSKDKVISNAVAAQENSLNDDNSDVHFDGKPLSHKSNAKLTQSIRRESKDNAISDAVAAQENSLDGDDVVHFDGKPHSHKSNAKLTQSIRRESKDNVISNTVAAQENVERIDLENIKDDDEKREMNLIVVSSVQSRTNKIGSIEGIHQRGTWEVNVEHAAHVTNYEAALTESENVVIAFTSSCPGCTNCGSFRQTWHKYAQQVHQAGMTNLLVAEMDCFQDACPFADRLPIYRWYHKGTPVGDVVAADPSSTVKSLMMTTKMVLDMESQHSTM